MGRFLPRKHEVLIVSAGGVGTTLLIDFISRYRQVNHAFDDDRLKHLPVPPVCLNQDIKIIYVFGDPVNATASLFRRGYQHEQSKKMQRYARQSMRPIPGDLNLEAYAQAGVDQFLILEHFQNWHDRYPLNDVLFVRFEKMWEALPDIFAFLDLPAAAVEGFPPQQDRRSNKAEMAPQVTADLKSLYAPILNVFERLPDVHLVTGNKVPMWRHWLLLTYQSRCAVIGQWHLMRRRAWQKFKQVKRKVRDVVLKPFGYKPEVKKPKIDDML